VYEEVVISKNLRFKDAGGKARA